MMTDPIADMFTRIRNGIKARFEKVDVPSSTLKINIVKILKEEGYVKNYKLVKDNKQGVLQIFLKYGAGSASAMLIPWPAPACTRSAPPCARARPRARASSPRSASGTRAKRRQASSGQKAPPDPTRAVTRKIVAGSPRRARAAATYSTPRGSV